MLVPLNPWSLGHVVNVAGLQVLHHFVCHALGVQVFHTGMEKTEHWTASLNPKIITIFKL